MTAASRLHHLALGARDVELVAGFYRDVFELPETGRHRYADGRLRSIWLDLGGSTLMIEHTEQVGSAVEGVSAGLFLLTLRVTPEARPAIEDKLRRLGFAIETRTVFTSYTRDPEHNRVALSHHPAAPLGG